MAVSWCKRFLDADDGGNYVLHEELARLLVTAKLFELGRVKGIIRDYKNELHRAGPTGKAVSVICAEILRRL